MTPGFLAWMTEWMYPSGIRELKRVNMFRGFEHEKFVGGTGIKIVTF